MTDAAPPTPARPPHTWRPIILWSAGILLAMGLAWFVGAVILPVRQTRAIVSAYAAKAIDSGTAIERLGGEERAAGRLALYLRLPKRFRHKLPETVTDYKTDDAVLLLFDCGRPGALVVPGLLRSRDPEVLKAVAWGLGDLRTRHPDGQHPWLDPDLYTRTLAGMVRLAGDESLGDEELRYELGDGLWALLRVRPVPGIPEAAVPHLIRALEAKSIAARCAAIAALADSGDSRARPALEAVLMKDEDRTVNSAAAEALKKIREQVPAGR